MSTDAKPEPKEPTKSFDDELKHILAKQYGVVPFGAIDQAVAAINQIVEQEKTKARIEELKALRSYYSRLKPQYIQGIVFIAIDDHIAKLRNAA